MNTESADRRYHRCMSENAPSGHPQPAGSSGFPGLPQQFSETPHGQSPWPLRSPRGQSPILSLAALAIALIATVLAIVGWFRPTAPSPPPTSVSPGPTYTEQQISDAKSHACAAFDLVNKGMTLETNGQLSKDPAMELAQGANARLTTISSGWYLKARLEPATPVDLAGAVRHLSDVLLDLGANYLAGAKDDQPAQNALKNEGITAFEKVSDFCK